MKVTVCVWHASLSLAVYLILSKWTVCVCVCVIQGGNTHLQPSAAVIESNKRWVAAAGGSFSDYVGVSDWK